MGWAGGEEIMPAEIKTVPAERTTSEKEGVSQSEVSACAINACATRKRRLACMRTC